MVQPPNPASKLEASWDLASTVVYNELKEAKMEKQPQLGRD